MKSATRSDSSPFYGAVHQSVFPPTGGIAKRAFDVSAACLGLIFLSPLFLMVMLLVKLSDRGPIFYGHRRIGHNGQEFRCLKFRTMVTNGDKVLPQQGDDGERESCDRTDGRREEARHRPDTRLVLLVIGSHIIGHGVSVHLWRFPTPYS